MRIARTTLWLPVFGLVSGCAVAPAPLAGDDAGDRLFMWSIKKEPSATRSYLVGSVHLMPSARTALAKGYFDALDAADALVVEIDPRAENQAEVAMMTMGLGSYPSEESLRDHISAETLERVKAQASAVGLPFGSAFRMRPWLLGVTLTVLALQRAGYSADQGVDQAFVAHAYEPKDNQATKEVIPLESARSQLSMLAEMPEELQLLLLKDSLGEVEKGADYLQHVLAAWQSGDGDALAELLVASTRNSPKMRPIYEKIFVARNHTMAESIERLHRDGRSYFIVVGAGHVVGPDGIIELLTQRGFQLEQMTGG